MRVVRIVLAGVLASFFVSAAGAQSPGLTPRVPNLTLTMPLSPPTFGFTSSNALGNLIFTNPVCIVSPPDETNRLFILEKRGRVIVITNLAAPTRTIFLDLTSRVASDNNPVNVGDERGLLGMAFHPGYVTNRYFYLCYTSTGALRDRLARFETASNDPNQGLANSELILIDQADDASNHNGGDLHFGPDGYLYFSRGDEGGGNDQYNNSQRIDRDFFSGILRIDVDKRPGNLPPNPHPAATTNYAVPFNNPFVGATIFNGFTVNPNSVRTEFWAVGLRNPWRMAFDKATGILYCGDVGQGAREEIDIILRGGNYGWAYREGLIAGPKAASAPAGFAHINPILDYSRSDGASVTGGVVYRGNRISQLFGAYVFADYVSGRIWAIRYNGINVSPRQILLTDAGIAAFGTDPRNGDILYADLNQGTNGTIDRLMYNGAVLGAPLPPTLADTGTFADLASLAPSPGIVPYDLNVPFWSDHAVKSRWFSVPNTNLTIGFSREGNWSFPTGTVWIKHFELELTNGVAESRKRLETRLIVRNAAGVYGVTYRWGDSLTNAALVAEEGQDESFAINDGGTTRTQVWHYPSRAECLQCHTPVGGYALGFNTAQLNREFDYGAGPENQVAALSRAGYFAGPVSNHYTLPALAHPADETHSLESRVRSYLAANCAQCHQPGGPSQGLWDARVTTPTWETGIIRGTLISENGDANNRVVVPGSLTLSMLLTRISSLGVGRMPPLATRVLDTAAINLISAWITNGLAGYQSFADWQVNHFGATNSPEAGASADADQDGAVNYLEYLTGTNPNFASEAWGIGIRRNGVQVEITYPRIANRGFEVQFTTDLFNTGSWQSLDVPENRPWFSATNDLVFVPVLITNSATRFYRVKVFEP